MFRPKNIEEALEVAARLAVAALKRQIKRDEKAGKDIYGPAQTLLTSYRDIVFKKQMLEKEIQKLQAERTQAILIAGDANISLPAKQDNIKRLNDGIDKGVKDLARLNKEEKE